MKWFQTLRLVVSPPCEKISELSSKRLDVELPPAEELSRRLHFLTCAACRRYDSQIKFLDLAFRKQQPPLHVNLSEEARQRIAARIAEERKGGDAPPAPAP